MMILFTVYCLLFTIYYLDRTSKHCSFVADSPSVTPCGLRPPADQVRWYAACNQLIDDHIRRQSPHQETRLESRFTDCTVSRVSLASGGCRFSLQCLGKHESVAMSIVTLLRPCRPSPGLFVPWDARTRDEGRMASILGPATYQ